MSNTLKIALVETSPVIRAGLECLLKRVPGFKIQLIDIVSPEQLMESVRIYRPDLMIINPILVLPAIISELKSENGYPGLKCFAFVSAVYGPDRLKVYDGILYLYDGAEEIKQKLDVLLQQEVVNETKNEDSQSLSIREKEIVVCVVKGMTNREIADMLYLSTHTVITHRRNIARKLQIHSASGLTVYAIVNKLVEPDDIIKHNPPNPLKGGASSTNKTGYSLNPPFRGRGG